MGVTLRPGERTPRPRAKIQRSQLDSYNLRPSSQLNQPTQQSSTNNRPAPAANTSTVTPIAKVEQRPQPPVRPPRRQTQTTVHSRNDSVTAINKSKPPINNTADTKTIPTLIEKGKNRRRIKLPGLKYVIPAIIAVILISGSVGGYLFLKDQRANKADIAIGKEFLVAVQSKDMDKAYDLTSQGFKSVATKEQLSEAINKISKNYPGQPMLIDKWKDKPTIEESNNSVVVFRSLKDGKNYYMRLVIEKENNSWKVLDLESKDSTLQADPSQQI